MSAPGEVETEVKVRVADPAAARRALRELGARRVRERHFEDNLLLDDDVGRLTRAGKVLRIRRAGGEGRLTFKGPRRLEDGVKSREEIELTSDPDALQEIFERLGLRAVFRYQKYRETWTLGELEVVVDETPIGVFLELEGPAAAIHAAAERLGYGRDDYVTDSYVGLFRASGASGDMVFAEPR